MLELISFFQRALPEEVWSGGGKRREEEEHPDREDQHLSTEQVMVRLHWLSLITYTYLVKIPNYSMHGHILISIPMLLVPFPC